MSTGSRTLEAVVGSVIVLFGLAFAIKHKAQISTWAENVFGSVNTQLNAAPSAPPPAPTTTAPAHPSARPGPQHPTTPTNATSPSVGPTVTSTFQPSVGNISDQTGVPPQVIGTVTPPFIPDECNHMQCAQMMDPSNQAKCHFPPEILARCNTPPPHQGTIPNVNEPHVNPYVQPPSQITPPPPAVGPPLPPPHAPTHPTTPSRPPPPPPPPRRGPCPDGSFPDKNNNCKPIPVLLDRTAKPKLQRGGVCTSDPGKMECGTKCRTNGIDYYVTCNPGARPAYVRAGVERGWFFGW
jgi:hypothetical protein